MSKQPEKDNLPGNYPRFSSISNHNEASTNQSTARLSTGFRGDNSFLGIGRKNEGLSATNRINEDDVASQQSSMIDENSVNEMISKELHSERELILNYVNASLNDNTNYVKGACKELKEDQEKGRGFAEKEITLLNELINKMKDSFRGELENLNIRMTQQVKEQSSVYEQNLQKLSERFTAFENKNNTSNMHQAEDPELVKLNREIEGIRANLQQIIQTSESKKQVDQSQQISDLNSEIQAIKTSISSLKQDWEPKAQEIHESTKQMLLNAVGQDKQIDKQIEDLQRYMFGFQKVFQHKLSITSEDLKLFTDSQDSFKKNVPFSFGGDMNFIQTEPISTLGTSHSAEFEVQEGDKLFMKKKEVINKPAAAFPDPTTTTVKQGLQPFSNTNIASQIPANPGNPPSGRNSLNADYYNIYNDGARAQPSVSSKTPFMEASQQNPKKKKRIFGEDSQSGSISWGNQSMRTFEQKNQMPFQYAPTGQTHFQSTETDQVRYETISNKDSLQQSIEGDVNPAALESKLSVKVNDSNADIFEDESNHSGSDSESTYSNFRLKDTMNFVQREFSTASGVSNQEKSLTSVDPLQKKPSLTNITSNSQNPFAPLPMKNPLFSQETNNNTAFTDRNTNYPLSIPSYTASTQQYNPQEVPNVQIQSTKKNSPFEYSSSEKLQFQQLKTIFESELEQSQKPSEIKNVTKIDNFMSKSKGKQIISGQTLNFMIASKGKKADNPLEHTYNEETSKLNGVALNDFAGDFRPKWGYDSQVSEASFKEEIEYQLDEEGFLLDQNGQILLDDNGEKIKLSEDNIKYLQQNQMIQDI